ncbi:hypothetical protein EDD85DRAFT_793792 [Armillaria nabsnona]|nr:hypothetical protein EDD85DRAFT_793792 [Armillaria nabsnona]
MYFRYKRIFTVVTTTLRAIGPFWNRVCNLPQLPIRNEQMFSISFGTWPQNAAMNGQSSHGVQMTWPNPYAYQLFPPPGFMPGPALYFENFLQLRQVAPGTNTEPVANRENIAIEQSGENKPITIDKNGTNQNTADASACISPGNTIASRNRMTTNVVAGPSQP